MEYRHLLPSVLFSVVLALTTNARSQIINADNATQASPTSSESAAGVRPETPLTPQTDSMPNLPSTGFGAQGQNVISSMPSVSTPADLPALDVTGNAIVPGAETVDSEAGFKKWRIAPVAGVGYVYDDNIFISHTNPVGSQIFKVSGGLSFQYGDYKSQSNSFVTFDYLGVGNFYQQVPSQNTYNDGYNLKAQYTWEKFWLLLESRYTYYNGANVQSGTFTKSTLLNNSLHGFYQYSDKTVLDCELQQISNLYPNNLNSYDNQLKLGFNYKTTEKLTLGMNGIVGFNPAQNSPTRTYQTINGRLQYTLTDKLDVKASAGVMASEFETGGQSLRTTPVFSIGTDYKPFTPTTISLLLYRRYNNSPIYSQQNYLATGLSLTASQQIFQHWAFSLGLNYENDTYIANQSGVVATRKDNTFSIRPALSYSFLKYLQADIYYQNSFNDSTLTSYAWSDNQYGVELKTAF
jgi:hypothetical protein